MESYNYTIKTDNYHKNLLIESNKWRFFYNVFCKLMQSVFLNGVQLYVKTAQLSPVFIYRLR